MTWTALRVLPVVMLLWPLADARAQPCATTGTNQTCTNSVAISGGAIGINDTATLTLTNTGTGAISGTNLGVSAVTANVTNSGTIQATGAGSTGISAISANVTNTGTISGSNVGISATTANVTNFGTISGTNAGIGAATANVINGGTIIGNFAISAINVANVINSGTISGGVSGSAIFGFFGSVANITNSGTISGAAIGINVSTFNILNSGTISADLAVAGLGTVINSGVISGRTFGINSANVNVTNSGTISGGIGISAATANITNSGTIIGTGGTALQFNSLGGPAIETLTLLPGSRIFGAIDMGGGADVVNVVAGRDVSWLVTLTNFTGTVNGSGAFAASGNRIATVDVTPFSLTDRTIMDFSRLVSGAIPLSDGQPAIFSGGGATAFAPPESAAGRVEDVFASIPGLSAYAADAVLFKNPTVTRSDGLSLWARGFVGMRQQRPDDILLGAANRYTGGMLGGDWQLGGVLLGAFVGAGNTQSEIGQNSGASDSRIVFGGGFGRIDWGGAFLNVAGQIGNTHTSQSRTIFDNIAPNNVQTAAASYDGWYASPEATIGLRFGLGTANSIAWTLMPNVRVRYLWGTYDGYTESGSAANMTVAARNVRDLEERGELKLVAQTFGPDGLPVARMSFSGGMLGVQRQGDATVSAALLGQPLPFATPGKAEVWGGFAGFGVEMRAGMFSWFGAAEYMALNDSSTILSGRAGMRLSF
jgi:Autotransporter beta-domain